MNDVGLYRESKLQDEEWFSHIEYTPKEASEKTLLQYKAITDSFIFEYGNFLPCSEHTILNHMRTISSKYSTSTIRVHLAAISKWHQRQGFDDPTRTRSVKTLLVALDGLKSRYPAELENLSKNDIDALERHLEITGSQSPVELLRSARDKSIILLGYWMAFSSFDFSLLKIENIDIIDGMGMKFIMPCPGWPKDEHFLPFLPESCPVKAMQNWLALSGLKHGPVYRKLDRWGNLGSSALREKSYIVILKEAADRSIEKHITGKSVKYGFLDWALENEWGLIDIQNHIMRHSITKKMLKALRTKKAFNLKHLG